MPATDDAFTFALCFPRKPANHSGMLQMLLQKSSRKECSALAGQESRYVY